MEKKVIWNYLNTEYWSKLIYKAKKSELVILLKKWNSELFKIFKIYGKFCIRFLKSRNETQSCLKFSKFMVNFVYVF